MFEVGQEVTVVTDKGIAYDGVILARANGDNGPGAYKISLSGNGQGQTGQWHKAADVFVREQTASDAEQVWETLIDHAPTGDSTDPK